MSGFRLKICRLSFKHVFLCLRRKPDGVGNNPPVDGPIQQMFMFEYMGRVHMLVKKAGMPRTDEEIHGRMFLGWFLGDYLRRRWNEASSPYRTSVV